MGDTYEFETDRATYPKSCPQITLDFIKLHWTPSDPQMINPLKINKKKTP